jgi:SET domain-containing protein
MTKKELLQELSEDTYVALRPSGVHGIGVFAIRDIPRGCRTIFSKGTGGWIKLSIDEVEDLPGHTRELIETYCLYDFDHYYVPDHGFKVMDIVNYLNHSSSPNVISIKDGEQFEAIANIPAGTELLLDYTEIAEHLDDYNS